MWDNHIYSSMHTMLLPYFEETALKSLINPATDWEHQTQVRDDSIATGFAVVPATVIPVFNCPSADGENPKEDFKLTTVFLLAVDNSYKTGQLYGTTNYIVCKGIADNFTTRPDKTHKAIRGMFDLNWAVPIRKITDGTSKTIAVGEGADGSAWQITDYTATPNSRNRNKVCTRLNGGQPYRPWNAWICGQVAFDTVVSSSVALFESGPYACTLEPINKNPVVNAIAAREAPNSGTTASQLSMAPDPGINNGLTGTNFGYPMETAVGNQSTSVGGHTGLCPNFRSDHAGGANFLFADGSVHFFNEDISMQVYQQMSTIKGEETVEIPVE